MPDQPRDHLLSVVIPVDAEFRLLPGALASLGTAVPMEILLVHDTLKPMGEVSRHYSTALAQRDERVRIIAGPARGRPAALNAGLAAARGGLIAFIDPADRWLADSLPARLAMLRTDPSLTMVFGGWRQQGRQREGLADCPGFQANRATRREGFILGCDALAQIFAEPIVRLSTVIARKAELRRIGGFAEGGGAAADWDLWMHIAQSGTIGCLPRPVAELAPSRLSPSRLAAERRVARAWRPIVARQNPAAARRGAARMMEAAARSAAAGHQPLRAVALRLGALAMTVTPLPAASL